MTPRHSFFVYFLFVLVSFSLFSCEEQQQSGQATSTSQTDPQAIIDSAMAAHGSARISGNRIEFDFRERHYSSSRQGGQFVYERIFKDSAGNAIRDKLSNEGLQREVNGAPSPLSAKDSLAYANSVNSVLYFALLPYFLNDRAVVKQYLGEASIKGEPYHKIRVTFRQEGGGKDHEDEYIYWFHRDRYTMDYLAYNYLVDGGGARFRSMSEVQVIEGIRFANYLNYKPKTDTREVATFDQLFESGELVELSRIDLENIQVNGIQ